MTQKMLVEEANMMRLSGQLDDALLAIEDCIEDGQLDAHAHNIRGLILGTLGRPKEAVDAYNAAVRSMPDTAIFIANAGIAMQYASGGYDASVATLRLALSRDPNLAYAYVGLGSAYRMLGDEARAQAEYRRALEILRKEIEVRPFDRAAWSQMWSVHHSLGDYRRADEARNVLKRIDRDALYEGDSAHVIAGPVRKPVAAGAE